jgi:hypothetical protein
MSRLFSIVTFCVVLLCGVDRTEAELKAEKESERNAQSKENVKADEEDVKADEEDAKVDEEYVEVFVTKSKAYTKESMKSFTPKAVALLTNAIKASAPDPKTQTQRVTAFNALLRDLRSDKVAFAAPLIPPYKVGDIGSVKSFKLLQVVDEDNMMVNPSYTTLQVLMQRDAPMTFERKFGNTSLWVSGISTKGHTDGQTIGVAAVLWISGTKTYLNALHAKTTVNMATRFPEKILEDKHVISLEDVQQIMYGDDKPISPVVKKQKKAPTRK